MRLDELRPGESASILTVTGSGPFRLRLLELGLVPGTKVTRIEAVQRQDPMVFRVRWAVLSIRREDAAHVVVDLSDDGGAKLGDDLR